jgi:hypothetical protein
MLQNTRRFARSDRAVGHYLATSSPGALTRREAQPELGELVEDT